MPPCSIPKVRPFGVWLLSSAPAWSLLLFSRSIVAVVHAESIINTRFLPFFHTEKTLPFCQSFAEVLLHCSWYNAISMRDLPATHKGVSWKCSFKVESSNSWLLQPYFLQIMHFDLVTESARLSSMQAQSETSHFGHCKFISIYTILAKWWICLLWLWSEQTNHVCNRVE